jgi:hypothetical protein
MDGKAVGQFSLAHPLGDAQCDEQCADALEVSRFVEIAPLESLVALDFLFQLGMK